MNDRTLIKISLAWSLVGIFVLILVASYAQPEQIKIKDLESHIGKTVLLQGEVLRISAKDTSTFIYLEDETGNTTIVAFDKIGNVTAKDNISAKGKVQVYKNEPELIASEICICDKTNCCAIERNLT